MSSLTKVTRRIWGEPGPKLRTPDYSYSFQISPQQKLLAVQLPALWQRLPTPSAKHIISHIKFPLSTNVRPNVYASYRACEINIGVLIGNGQAFLCPIMADSIKTLFSRQNLQQAEQGPLFFSLLCKSGQGNTKSSGLSTSCS